MEYKTMKYHPKDHKNQKTTGDREKVYRVYLD